MRKLIYTKKWLFIIVCLHQAMALISSGVTLFLVGLNISGIIALMLNLIISAAIFMKIAWSKWVMQFLFAFAIIALIIQMVTNAGAGGLTGIIILSAIAVLYLFLLVSVTRYTYKENKEG